MTKLRITLSNELYKKLNEMAMNADIPKDEIIEKALKIYFDQIQRNEYITSFKDSDNDENIIAIAEEGMDDYFNQLKF